MTKNTHHPKAKFLVYGFVAFSLLTSSAAGLAAHHLASPRLSPLAAKTLALAVALLGLRRFYRVAGGLDGINRAVGDGSRAVSARLLGQAEAAKERVRLVVVSDTHGETPAVPMADVLVHCGDVTLAGTPGELHAFCDWLEALPHPNKVVIAGNHDFCIENKQDADESRAAKERLKSLCTFLENEAAVVAGLKFYGSPHSPWIREGRRMSYQNSSENLEPAWAKIPNDVDVLITHTPPKGFGDRILLGVNVGCPALERRIREVKPRYHLFGHIHEAYGIYESSFGCVFVNAAICNLLYEPSHAPIVIDVPVLDKKEKHGEVVSSAASSTSPTRASL
jgi:Icc-related predicted phosphoesterase